VIIDKFSPTASYAKWNEPEDLIAVNEASSLITFPEPFQQSLDVEFDEAISKPFVIRILSAEGIVMKHFEFSSAQAYEKYSLDLNDLPRGIYLLQLISENKNQVVKIIRQ